MQFAHKEYQVGASSTLLKNVGKKIKHLNHRGFPVSDTISASCPALRALTDYSTHLCAQGCACMCAIPFRGPKQHLKAQGCPAQPLPIPPQGGVQVVPPAPPHCAAQAGASASSGSCALHRCDPADRQDSSPSHRGLFSGWELLALPRCPRPSLLLPAGLPAGSSSPLLLSTPAGGHLSLLGASICQSHQNTAMGAQHA